MTTQDFARIEALFHAALEQPREHRAAFLRENESDAAIVASVERLLELDGTAGPDPVSTRLGQITRAAPPRMIGPYRLLRELGAGGMGTVFLAERDVAGTAQQVALKLLHGVPTEAGRRRMARERALLAGLNHPHIAGHIDGGESADGQPYLVMDYVESETLPEYLARVQPSVPTRLRLFLSLCEAVQHAHQRLILHRDIKPSNVIVRTDGSPVLLDFGVGTLLEAGANPDHTATRAYTPGYSAPEQRRGLTATTATDVFGLGALLFDLLSDRRLSELCTGDAPVPLPSGVVQDATRRRLLRGDLDRIVRKATASDPEQRYDTAAALADDVQRYLRGLPIAAAPDRIGYRLRKFVRRHRVGVAATVAIVIATALTLWRLDAERQRAQAAETLAQREAANARASRDFLASVLAQTSPKAVRGEPVTVTRLLANAAAQLESDRRQDARTRAIAWLTIAEVYNDIKDPRPGLAAADAALALFRPPAVPDLELQARALRVRAALLLQLEHTAEARATAQQVIELRRRQGAPAPVLAKAYSDYANAAMHGYDFKTAERYQQQALRLSESGGSPDPALRADILLGLTGSAYYQNNMAGAARFLDQAQAAANALPGGDDFVQYRLHRYGMMVRHSQHRYADALRHAEQALALAERVYGRNSRLTADMELYLALLLDDLGRSRAALPHYEQAQAIARVLRLDESVQARDQVRLATAYARLGDNAEAIELITSALAKLPDDAAWLSPRIQAHLQRGLSFALLDKPVQAEQDFARALQLSKNNPKSFSSTPAFVQLHHAQALLHMRRFEQAQAALDAAAPSVEGYRDIDPKGLLDLRRVGAELALARGDLDDAARLSAEAMALAERHYLPDTPPIADVELLAARIAWQQGDRDRARQLFDHATTTLRREVSPQAPQLAEIEQLTRQFAPLAETRSRSSEKK